MRVSRKWERQKVTELNDDAPTAYPVRLEISYVGKSSRWLLFLRLFFFWALVLPLIIVGIAVTFLLWLSWFAVMNDGRYPRLLVKPMIWWLRFNYRTTAYLGLMTDRFPLDEGHESPVSLDVVVPPRTSRLTTFFRFLLILPHAIALIFVSLAWYLTTIVAWFAILFTGRYPKGLFNFGTGVLRWSARYDAYRFFLVDKYPPFSLD